MKVVIDIGHGGDSRDPGAVNERLGINEHQKCKELAELLVVMMPNSTIVPRKSGITQLCRDINTARPDFVLSIHANAALPSASGTETLYWHSSSKGKRAAEIIQRAMVMALDLPDRGAKPLGEKDRGGAQLRLIEAPVVIIEPYFLSNVMDVARYNQCLTELVESLVSALSVIEEAVI